ESLAPRSGRLAPLPPPAPAPAPRSALPAGPPFGLLASPPAPFCATCARSRLPADGFWLPCLSALSGLPL
ncbi:GTP 3',8-cyclase MoaA, partial [Mycobacterium tuberculosis]